jgi:hypothetical protein
MAISVKALLATAFVLPFLGFPAITAAEPLSTYTPATQQIDREQDDKPDEPESVPQAASPVQSKYPGLLVRPVKIADTDPALANDSREHWTYYQPGVKHRGQLLVGLPGTHGKANNNSSFDALAAQLGYHVLVIDVQKCHCSGSVQKVS